MVLARAEGASQRSSRHHLWRRFLANLDLTGIAIEGVTWEWKCEILARMGNAHSPKSDEFEAKEMRDGTPIVHRDKRVSRGLAGLLLGGGSLAILIAIFVAFANSTASRPVPAAHLPFVIGGIVLLGLAVITLGVVMAVVRTVVTEAAVHIKYGLWGPTIPIGSICSCKVTKYNWTEFGGWGIRVAGGTWAYVPSGDRVVEIVFNQGGVEKRVLVGAENPDETVRQIERVRARSSKALPVRVDSEVLAEDRSREEQVEVGSGDESSVKHRVG